MLVLINAEKPVLILDTNFCARCIGLLFRFKYVVQLLVF